MNTCTQSAGASPKPSGSCTTAIASPGTYVFRFLENNGYNLAATSNTVTVACLSGTIWNGSICEGKTISASPSSIAPGQAIQVSWSGSTSRYDWIAVAKPGDSVNSNIKWDYMNTCTQSAGASPKSSGTCSYALSTPGTYEFRFLENNVYTLAATSNTVTVACLSGTIWNGSICEGCINGATNPPECTIITPPGRCVNGATNYPICTINPGGSCINGATNPPACDNVCANGAINPPICDEEVGDHPVNSSCSRLHYACFPNVISTGSQLNNISNWTWTCTGFAGGSNASCSELKKKPSFIEN